MSRSEAQGEQDTVLHIDGTCPECAGPFRAGIWDHSLTCGYCGSLLVSARELAHGVFVAANRRDVSSDPAALIAERETRDYASSLAARFRVEEGVELDLSAWLEPKIREHRERVLRELAILETVDFFVPYQIHEQTVAQGILGRRKGFKESFLQGFDVEDISRLYDTGQYNLRDRGLKLFGFSLQQIGEAHLERAQGRFIAVCESAPGGPPREASKVRAREETEIICMLDRTVRERRLRVYKHMTYAHARQGVSDRHYLIDRQFGTIAGELDADEAQGFRRIPALPTSSVLTPPEIRVIASECPNCGWQLELPRHERIVFCPTCALGIRVTPKELETQPYRVGVPAPPELAASLLYFPFWVFRFALQAGGREYRRIWEWLEAVAPQPVAVQFREHDPEQSLLYVPARSLYGNEQLDDAFAQLAGWVNWRQPALSADRPIPDPRARMLGVDLDAEEARELARFSLLALHDVQSTRRLNAAVFKQMIADTQLDGGEPFLAALPLSINDGFWSPPLHAPSAQPAAYRTVGSTVKGLPLAALEQHASLAREIRRFSLF